MSRLLLIDPVCPGPYEARTLHDRAMGGAEAAAVRVAEGLAQRGHRVTVAQCGRHWPARSPGGVAYVPFDYDAGLGHLPHADAAVVLRQPKVLPKVRQAYPEARLALWLHDVPGSRQKKLGPLASRTRSTVVAVSDAHRAALDGFLRQTGAGGDSAPAYVPLARIHTPVDDDLHPDGTVANPDKLVCLAGPRAGLDEVLAAFAHVRRRRPWARLFVIESGPTAGGRPPYPEGVIRLGALPHRAALQHVREAFALFHPQSQVEEPCGLVFAEANAVGTPVLAHPHAASREALGESAGDGRQLVDARDPEAAARRLDAWWTDGRPLVAPQPRFRLTRVLDDWERLLDARSASARRAVRPYPSLSAVSI